MMTVTGTITNALMNLSLRTLKRLQRSDKEYLVFEHSVFNAGVVYTVKCTNILKIPAQSPNFNGYDFIIENDSTTKYYIEQTIKDKTI